MKRQKTKLAVALLALACAGVCVGAGAASVKPSQASGVTAQAETTYETHEIGTLGLHVNSTVGGAKGNNAVLYLQREDGEALPILDWSKLFTTTDGYKVNGEVVALSEMKSTEDGMYFKFDAVNAGDVITIGGEYVCEEMATKYVIGESKFIWNGSGWEKYLEVDYTVYEIGALKFHTMQPNSSTMAYFNRLDGETIPIKSTENNVNWDTFFHFLVGSGVGITLNGQSISPTLKFPDQVFIELSASPSAGDVLVIGGTFYSQELAAKYVITRSAFKFNGTEWESYTESDEPTVTYTEYRATSIGAAASSTDSCVYIYPAAGVSAFPNGNDDWDSLYGFVAGSGDGLKLNGEALSTTDIKLPGTDLYIALGATAKEGDILTIDGAYANDTTAIKLVFDNCALKYNGTAWETVVTYTEYNVGKLNVLSICAPGGESVSNEYLYLSKENGSSVDDWTHYTYESGEGFKINGEAATLNALQNVGSGLYLAFDAVNEGDVLSIGGTYVCESTGIRYVIDEAEFVWTGAGWEKHINYTEYEVASLTVHLHSTAGNSNANATTLWLYGTGDNSDAWAYYTYESGSGVGFKINGEDATANVQDFSGGLYFKDFTVEAGDVITIGGTYSNSEREIKYIIPESSFTWTGSGWEAYIDYKTYEVGTMKINADPSHSGAVYMYTASGEKLPIASWEYRFPFYAGSGVGVTLNGMEINTDDIKSPDGDFYVAFNGVYAEAGDVLAIGGTFRNVDTATAYVITLSEFIYDGTTWANKIDVVKADACKALEAYKDTFSEEDYYEAEWNSFATLLENGKTNINAATTEAEVNVALEAAKAAMDEVVTKTESDAIFDDLKVSEKEALAAYKNEADYREAEWTAIQEILTQANAAIDAAESVTAINDAVAKAKADMDALKTNAQWEADEAYVAAAKVDLAAYKTEADYRATEWAEIQAIISDASAKIDAEIGNTEAIDEIVANAKADMDDVFTATEAEAAEAAAAAAKADLAAYKSEADYYEAEWAEIQAIISEASADIDEALGDDAAIAAIVANAKADMDEVKASVVVDEEAFAAAKASAIDEVRNYYGALDHSQYSDDAEIAISGYVEAAMYAIENATTVEEMQAAVTQFKTNVENVEKEQPSGGNNDNSDGEEDGKSGGCGSVVAGGLSAGIALATAAAVAVLRKKKED